MAKNFDIMLDLETFGTGPNAAIIAIGACTFDTHGEGPEEEFYQVIDLEISTHPGEIDPNTVLWWLGQNEEAREALLSPENTLPLGQALSAFSAFAEGHGPLWSNGPTFDEIILRSAYTRYGLEFPIKFWESRCMRTVKALRGAPNLRREGTHHNALDDAIHQAKHVQKIFRELML